MFASKLLELLGEIELAVGDVPKQQSVKATLEEWLEINGLDRVSVENFLAANPIYRRLEETKKAQRFHSIPLSVEDAWNVCSLALISQYPMLSKEIEEIELHAPKCLQSRKGKFPTAFTYDLGLNKLPFVSLHYNSRSIDLLAMAHEFGHALQIVSSQSKNNSQMPPVGRECCAFLAEEALLVFLRKGDGILYEAVRRAWNEDNRIYMQEHVAILIDALKADSSIYDYRWNYPLARAFSRELTNQKNSGELLFSTGNNAPSFLSRFVAKPPQGTLV